MYLYTQEHRLRKADEFSSVFIFRKVKFGSFLKVHYKPNGLQNSRLGLIVSKKIHKRAVKRNYMKRVLRELFRINQIDWANHDIIIRVQKKFEKSDFLALKTEFLLLTKVLNNHGAK